MLNIFKSSLLAGLCIAIGGTVFLKVGGLAGAVLFSFGLLTVVHYGYKLYTCTAGFFDLNSIKAWGNVAIIIVGNAIACYITALAVTSAIPELQEVATSIYNKRVAAGPFNCFLLAIFCGFIMTTAVKFGREKSFLPLLFGVPLFIMSGFAHSIADAYYFSFVPFSLTLFKIWGCELFGNLVGCNLYRICVK